MRRVLILLLLCLAPALGMPQVAELVWLQGAWTDGSSEEVWSRPAGGTMMGYARTIEGKKTVFFEYLRLEETDDGVDYVASPRGTGTTHFRLVESSPGFARFSNPQHDFPKEIRYRLDGDKLTAEVTDGERTESWTYTRQAPDYR